MEHNLTVINNIYMFNNIDDFNNNLTIIRDIYNSQKDVDFNKHIETLIYMYIFNFINNNAKYIKLDKFNKILKIYTNLNNSEITLNKIINDLSNLFCDNYILFVFDQDYKKDQKLNKFFIYRELLNIINSL